MAGVAVRKRFTHCACAGAIDVDDDHNSNVDVDCGDDTGAFAYNP